jgi:flagellar hook-associated protein 2
MSTVSSLSSASVTAQLKQVETRQQAPITSLNNQITTEKSDISAWGVIKGSISTLSTSLAGISSVSTVTSRTATTTKSSVASATATNSAAVATYNLTNVSLAKTQEIYSSELGSAGATLTGGAGSLTFTLKGGTTATVAIGSGSLTLTGVAAAINKAAGGVQASVLGTSAGARLVLQSSSTGSQQAFSVTGTGALAQFAYSSAAGSGANETRAQTATNASLKINGVPVTSTSNTLASTITGLTINLTGSSSGTAATTISVSSAPTALSGALSSVATSLNSAISSIAKEIKFVPPPKTGSASASASAPKSGPLLGNFTATNLSNQLLTAVSGAAASGLSANAIGLKVSSAGAVSFDSATFASAYATNPTGVQALVADIYTALNNLTTAAIGGSANGVKTTGSIGGQTDALNAQVTSINQQIAQITKGNNAQLSILIQEYTAAENAASRANITQAYLSVFSSSGSGSSKG